MVDYFGVLEEESIRDNFVLIYELLDEVMDFGYPQITEAGVLKEYITQGAHRLAVVAPPMAVTNRVSWRPEGIVHKKNEVYLDVIEKLNCLVAANGSVLHSEILGFVMMKCRLTGMPELKLGLNDKACFEAQGRQGPKQAVELEVRGLCATARMCSRACPHKYTRTCPHKYTRTLAPPHCPGRTVLVALP
ncbi:hypothetical protein EON67_10385, partial [archaeon]